QGDGVDLMLTQEGRNGFQAIGMGRKLLNHAGIGLGGEADADPVGPGADINAVKGRFKTGHFWAPQNQPGYRSSLCTGNLGVTEYRRCVVAHPCTSGSPAFLPREEASRGSRGWQ